MLSHCSVTLATRLSTASLLVMSVETPMQAQPGAQCLDSCAPASESFSGLRAAITTLYPFCAKSSAVARPTPCRHRRLSLLCRMVQLGMGPCPMIASPSDKLCIGKTRE